MLMTQMSAADFEARYQADPDPWGYTSSAYEREKYAATLAACGPGPFACALELGSSIGVLSEQLASRCRRLITVDGAPTAVAAARARLAPYADAMAILGPIPAAIPIERYDLVLASEILYYLEQADLDATLAIIQERLARGGRLVAVHWRPAGAERPFNAASVHGRLREQSWLTLEQSGGTEEYLLDVLERR